ncbi:hypothetical protein HNQ91_005380 [Filimonas zeae]|uniref:Uncharacterized protein n=1 Tax=Filimonas zeae TaxID=1737353 RepID=A0A917MYP4_9BACT|nr:hypothetical protein [Filimonas zeae]MDR6342296.1 hypothetical protein [Filimonas zeae]GGH80764.1 hypothetical protein GCM10011379_52120 [Filimonas zeae]
MLNDLTGDQLLLADYMSYISEEGYTAGWMESLEFSLWKILIEGGKQYGRHIVTEQDIEQLRYLSEKCGCWIAFDDIQEETAIDLESWKKIYDERVKSGAPIRG